MKRALISTVEEYISLLELGKSVDPSKFEISENLFARVLKGNSPERREALTEHVDDRSCFCFAGDGMLEILGLSHMEILDHLGFEERYVQQKLHRKFLFELLICDSTESFRPILADWNGVGFFLKKYFPQAIHKYWDIHEKELLSTSFKDLVKDSPYPSFFYVRSRGYKSEGYLTEKRFLEIGSEVSLWQWRLFLYLNLGLRKLYDGSGKSVNTKTGELTTKEYFLPNILRKDLPKKHIFLPLKLEKKEGNWEV